MATTTSKQPKFDNLAELMEQLGGIPLERILLQPPLGTATEKDVLALRDGPKRRLCELVDGVLVEKVVGTPESLFASYLGHLLWVYVEEQDLGTVLGADGMLRLFPGRVRIPDVSFISWASWPGERVSEKAIAEVVPNLAVEVLSKKNTLREMERKLRDYFQSGTAMVWLLYPKTQTAEIYTSTDEKKRIGKNQSLDGGDVLPGLSIPLKRIFSRTDPRRPRR
ncbi:MAG TPA: Uma2 family endonuclease [Gemmataceae bacterium]|nr:Uma2 family endonuclease [Gemmataceae bacterium]